MPGLVKRLLLGVAKVAVAIVALSGLYLGYGLYAEWSATRKASTMCTSIHAGDPAGGLRARALADGANALQSRWYKLDGVDMLYITYIGMPPFSRHLCVVEAQDGRDVLAKRSYLD